MCLRFMQWEKKQCAIVEFIVFMVRTELLLRLDPRAKAGRSCFFRLIAMMATATGSPATDFILSSKQAEALFSALQNATS